MDDRDEKIRILETELAIANQTLDAIISTIKALVKESFFSSADGEFSIGLTPDGVDMWLAMIDYVSED